MSAAPVLVTGAAGFIGHHVVRLLVEQGRPVRAVLRPGEDPRNLAGIDPARVERVEADVLDRDRMRTLVRGCDVVYHLAAVYRTWVPDPKVIYDVNVTGTANVLAAAAEAGVRKVVYTSSIAAVGVREDGVPSDEATPFNLWAGSFDYVRSKYLGQQVALAFAPLVDVTVVGPGMPLGPGDVGPTPTGKTLVDALSGRIRVCFAGGLNIVDVEDVARGHLLAEERGRRGECYLLTGHNLDIFALVAEMRRVLGMRHKMFSTPVAMARAAGWALEQLADRVTGKEPLITAGSVAYASQALHFDNRKAREELGFTVRPLDETLRRAAEWFAANGYL
ncbi:NAD-dependent epimerase/dehydratase family protein [Nannocystis bainbridge]|uniref:NAD-dependent epimerase/dehydratase family protein n=1 Tax=Nannocystis bainbridge TaxID=2995303 RepID=A0ABT5E1P4_9BACT|nr:NAD-dependent epimerase/dehydratase family protein [Nannocystis bainbridge]MDC0719782.1 NAD-dependent epimerase/dehydratase family protein [Nannocystis bainbridge]